MAGGYSDHRLHFQLELELDHRFLKSARETGASASTSAAFSPDGGLLLTTHIGGELGLWDTRSGEEFGVFSGRIWDESVYDGCFSPRSTNGETTVAVVDRAGRITVAGLNSHLELATSYAFELPEAMYCCAFSPDGNRLLAAGANGAWHMSSTLNHSPLQRGTLQPTPLTINDCAFSPTDRDLFAFATDHGLQLQHFGFADARALPLEADNIHPSARACAFSPDGTLIAGAFSDGAVRLWTIPASADDQPRLLRLDLSLFGLSFSPDGRLLASGDEQGHLSIWRVSDGALLGSLELENEEIILSCEFSPDGQRIAVAGRNVDGGAAKTTIWQLR